MLYLPRETPGTNVTQPRLLDLGSEAEGVHMTLITTLTLTDETDSEAHYAEELGEDGSPLLGTVSVQKWALPTPTPSTVRRRP